MKVKAIREKMGELHDKATALTNLATNEKRDMTAQEKAEFDGHVTEYKRLEAEDLPRAEWLEKEQERLAQARVTPTAPQSAIEPNAGGDGASLMDYKGAPRVNRIVIPAQSRFRYGTLKSYKGPKAEEAAYMAGRWYLATIGKHDASAEWCKEHGLDVRFRGALKESANELGGFLVFEEMEQAIIDLRELYGVFRREATVTPMASDTKIVPRRTSGVTAYFVGENGEITESEKAWDNVKLVAKKLAALTRWSTELSEDAIISIGDDLTNEMAYAFAKKEDECGFIGDGTSTYGGIVGVTVALEAGSVVDAASGNTGFETLDLTDFEAVVGKLPTYAEANAKWYISKPGYAASMMRLIDAAGGNTSAQIQAGPAGREFLGYPVVVTHVLNSTLGADASKIKAVFGDLKMGALLGNRRGMSIMASDQRYFEYDQIGIKGTERFDINVHETGTSTAAGALVALKSAAS